MSIWEEVVCSLNFLSAVVVGRVTGILDSALNSLLATKVFVQIDILDGLDWEVHSRLLVHLLHLLIIHILLLLLRLLHVVALILIIHLVCLVLLLINWLHHTWWREVAKQLGLGLLVLELEDHLICLLLQVILVVHVGLHHVVLLHLLSRCHAWVLEDTILHLLLRVIVSIHKDTAFIRRLAHLHGILGIHVHVLLDRVAAILVLALSLHALVVGREDLNFAILGQKFHVWWTVQEHLSWDGWKWISEGPELVGSMGKTTIFCKFADTSLLKIATHLRLVVAVDGTDIVFAWEVFRHGLHKETHISWSG